MSSDENLEQAVSVTLNIGLGTVVAHGLAYDSEGEPSYGEPITLGDVVAERLARMLLDDAKKAIDYPSISERISRGIDAAISEKLADILDREVTPTNEYGRPMGEPRTLSEEIVKKAEAWFTSYPRDSFGRDKGTNAQRLIAEAVGRVLENEVKATVQAAKSEALGKVKEAASRIFAEQYAKEAVSA